MTKFSFMSFLLIFVIVRDTIYILRSIYTLSIVKNQLNLTCKELNFRIFLMILIHIPLCFMIDIDKANENKLGFIFLMLLIYSIVTYVAILVESSTQYLFENNTEEDNDVE